MAGFEPFFGALFNILILITIIALVARRLRVPYTVALVFAGLITPLFPGFSLPEITPEIFMMLLLPPLVFKAAMNMNLKDVRRDADMVLSFAFIGTLLSVVFIALFTYFFLRLFLPTFGLLEAFLLGVIAAPTDPVAVESAFQKLKVPKRLSRIIEGESLFNDGVAIVLYSAIISAFVTNMFVPLLITGEIILAVIGGAIIGGVLGYAISRILCLSEDKFTSILLSFITVYGTYQLAETLQVSGIIAVAVAGLTMMSLRNKSLSQESTNMLYAVWDFVAFLATSVAFIVVGVDLKLGLLWNYLWIVLPAICIILFTRFLMVYLISTVLYMRKKVIPGTWRDLIVWSGLRGPVSIVMALGLSGLHIEHAAEITAITFGVIVFSILVQGLSLSKVVQKLGVANETW